MKARTGLTVALLAFVIASVGFLVAKESKRPPAAASPPRGTAVVERPGPGPVVVAYYFHGRFRCASCREIERLSAKAIREGFPEEIRSGRLAFRAVDVDRPENRHFVEEYRLSSQSLVIVAYRGDRRVRWDTLEKVWTLLGSETEFLSYVRSGISAYLTGA